MNNNLRPFLILIIAVAALLLIQLIPSETIEKTGLNSISLFSDITKAETDEELERALANIDGVNDEEEECPEGIFPFEDFSEGGPNGMAHFYDCLTNCNKMDRPVRIAYFGDSFIEGDILTADLREHLQNRFGGHGVGFTDINPPFAGFRKSLPLTSHGWSTRHILMKDSCESYRLSPTQRYGIPLGSGTTEFKAYDGFEHLKKFETSTLYIRSSHPVSVKAKMNGDSIVNFNTKGDGTIETLTCRNDMNSIAWTVNGGSSVTCFGAALEGKKGVILDNFSFRGSSGLSLAQIPQKQWNAWGAARPYDLLIFEFGGNVAVKNKLKYEDYNKAMSHVINMIREAYPNASFLIISSGDRECKINGQFKTLPGVKALVKYQKLMAADNHISYWNLYEAMGGEGSIVEMTKTEPKQARTDYTHITREGGEKVARIIFDSLMYSYEKYLRTKKKN